jgi:phosphoribosylanthranilate isomerase
VAEAAGILHPDVVDVSSGVESAPGIKDADSIRRFVNAAHSPFPIPHSRQS